MMVAMRIVLLDSFTTDQGDPDAFWGPLAQLGELQVFPRTAPAELVPRCDGAFAAITNKVPFTAETFARLPELRYVGVTATGVNIVDLDAARRAHIAVTNVAGYATEAVAQLVFAHLLHFTHDVAGHDAAVKAGGWAAAPDFCFFRQPLVELSGKTMVVIGTGAIGGAVAALAEAFGMRVLRAAVPGSPGARRPNRTPLEEALPLADVVTLHCPLTDATRGMVGAAFLAALRPGAILVNTGRGGLVDEVALLAALDAGRLGGAALDVLGTEPPPRDHPLTNPSAPWARRVLVTPHIGWGTVEARRRLALEAARNLAAFIGGEARSRVV
jgi:glycerate dehydrogenase